MKHSSHLAESEKIPWTAQPASFLTKSSPWSPSHPLRQRTLPASTQWNTYALDPPLRREVRRRSGPSRTPARKFSRTRRRRPTSRLTIESLESRVTPAITAGIVSSSLASTNTPDVTIGEIVRQRVVVQEPLSGNYDPTAFNVLAYLPSGLQYCHGTADMALVSAQRHHLDAGPDRNALGLDVTGNNVNVNSVTPTFGVPFTSISTNPTTGGIISNTGISHANDNGATPDYVVIEFNAIVLNVAGNQASTPTNLTTNFHVSIGGTTCTCLGTDTVDVVEPSITNLTKTAQVSADGSTATYTLTFSNTGHSTAYDVQVVDNPPTGLTLEHELGPGRRRDRSDQSVYRLRAEPDVRLDCRGRLGHDHLYDGDRRRRSERPTAHQHGRPPIHQPARPERDQPEPDRIGDARLAGRPGRRAEWKGRRRWAERLRGHRVGDDHRQTTHAEVGENSLSGFVFGDTNEDGFFDAGDAMLTGVPIALVNEATGKTVATATTDASGFYIHQHSGRRICRTRDKAAKWVQRRQRLPRFGRRRRRPGPGRRDPARRLVGRGECRQLRFRRMPVPAGPIERLRLRGLRPARRPDKQ